MGASCSSMPALCSRNTNEAAEPSRIGTSSAVMSTYRLSRPRPAQADSRCSTVFTFGPPGRRRRDAWWPCRVSHDRERVDRDVDRLRQVDAAKHDAGVGRRRAQRQLDPLAAVHADADGAGHGLEGALLRACDHVTCPLTKRARLRARAETALGERSSRRVAAISPPACAGTPGSRSRPCRCWPARRPWPPPGCGRCARRWACVRPL